MRKDPTNNVPDLATVGLEKERGAPQSSHYPYDVRLRKSAVT
jgi:hypothetical protein